MKRLDEQKALHFILRKIYNKQGETDPYADWLHENDLLSGDETFDEEEKIAVYGKVMLTQTDIDKLKVYYHDHEILKFYEKLDDYLANRRKRPYRSHYKAIQSWVIESVLGAKRHEPLHQEVKHWNDE